MGNKFPIVSLLLLAICLPTAIYISHYKMPELRKKMYSGMDTQLKRKFLPVSGLDKFYADTQWVQLVQEMAKQNMSEPDKNKKVSEEEQKNKRVKQAEYFYAMFDRLSDLDPNNENYYMLGALFLQNDRPDDAIALLQKGDKMLKSPSWKFPFYQYHIKRNIIAGNDTEKEKPMIPDMCVLLKEAMGRSNAPMHVQNKWLKLEAQKNGFDDDDVGRLKLWAKFYEEKTVTNTPEASYESQSDIELRNQVMSLAQKMAIENFEKQKKATGDDKSKLEKQHKEISDIFFRIAPKGHYSPVSLMPYDAGDLFDVHTGTPVKPYGVDPEMLQKGIVVVYKGAFNQLTGKPRVADE